MVTKHILLLILSWIVCLLTFHFVLHSLFLDFALTGFGLMAIYRLLISAGKQKISDYRKY